MSTKNDEITIKIVEDDEDSCQVADNIGKLTGKKRQYLETAIVDKNGQYEYLENPGEYKKARKRLQNRESAVRSRMRKKSYQDTLEETVQQKDNDIELARAERDEWRRKFESLQDENTVLRNQIAHLETQISDQDENRGGTLIGGSNVINIAMQPSAQSTFGSEVSQQDLQALKDEVLSTLDRRLSEHSESSKNPQVQIGTKNLKNDLTQKLSDKDKFQDLKNVNQKLTGLDTNEQSVDTFQHDDDMEFTQNDDSDDGLFEASNARNMMEMRLAGSSRAKRTRVKVNKRQRLDSILTDNNEYSVGSSNERRDSINPQSFLIERRQDSYGGSSLFMLAIVLGLVCCTGFLSGNMENGRVIVHNYSRKLLSYGNEDSFNTNNSLYDDQPLDLMSSDVSDQQIPDINLLIEQNEQIEPEKVDLLI